MHRIIAIGAALLFSVAAFAQQPQTPLDYSPVACFTGGELPVLQVGVHAKGKVRAYFRHATATDWCSVDGEDLGPVANVVLPRFDTGDQIQYYFVLLDGKRIVDKSPQIYQVKVEDGCKTLVARHKIFPVVECLPPGASPIGQSLAAGYALPSSTNGPTPPQISPDRPEPSRVATTEKH